MKGSFYLVLTLLIAGLLAACSSGPQETATLNPGLQPVDTLSPAEQTQALVASPSPQLQVPMLLNSSAFNLNGTIPQQYTCDGQQVSPPLSWADAPIDTESLALVMYDPDAPGGDYVHWVVYNIPAAVNSLPEGAAALIQSGDQAMTGIQMGLNSARKAAYAGPCPPSGQHRYIFHLFALDTTLKLDAPTRQDLLNAVAGHVIGESELQGVYQRP